MRKTTLILACTTAAAFVVPEAPTHARLPTTPTSARRTRTRLAATPPTYDGAAANRAVEFFAAWNVRDMDAACACYSDDCVYEDTQYAGAFEGKAKLREHLDRVADALPESFAFVVDDVADGGDTVGIRWHVENEGKPLPFTRGASIYKANANGLLCSGFDVPEPAPLKPGGTGLALLSLASKIIDEPVRAVPLVLAGVYCFQLFLAEGQLLPGPSTLALDGATWVEVRDLSLNFWFVGPSLFGGFPVVHPGLEAIFNLVLAWSALFAGFAADGRRGRPQGSMLPTLAGMQFLTNAFFLPYLATRPREEEGVLVALDELTPAERAAESRALPVLLGGVGAVSIYWFCNARPEFGGLEERLGSLRTLLAGDRLGSSFLVDLGLYAAFQSWLIPDDLKRRGVAAADQAPFRALGAVPFVGLVAYLALRPRLPATRE